MDTSQEIRSLLVEIRDLTSESNRIQREFLDQYGKNIAEVQRNNEQSLAYQQAALARQQRNWRIYVVLVMTALSLVVVGVFSLASR